MSSPYLPQLIQIAQQELPAIQYDLTNASTLYTLQAAAQRMHNVLAYLTHHCIMASQPAQAFVAPPVQQVQQPVYQQPVYQAPAPAPVLNYSPHLAPPMAAPLPGFGVQSPPVQASQVTEVILTPQGTKVIPPGGIGATVNLPPGSHADASFGRAAPVTPPFTPQAPVGDVMLPQGGAMTPEVAAALGARNITAEQPR